MKLKNSILSIAMLAALLGTANAAQAQVFPGYAPNPNLVANPEVISASFANRFREITQQINTAAAYGQLSPAEASSLLSGLNLISTQFNYAISDGLTNDETRDLVAKLTVFAQQVTGQITANTNAMPPSMRARMPGGRYFRANNSVPRWREYASRAARNFWR